MLDCLTDERRRCSQAEQGAHDLDNPCCSTHFHRASLSHKHISLGRCKLRFRSRRLVIPSRGHLSSLPDLRFNLLQVRVTPRFKRRTLTLKTLDKRCRNPVLAGKTGTSSSALNASVADDLWLKGPNCATDERRLSSQAEKGAHDLGKPCCSTHFHRASLSSRHPRLGYGKDNGLRRICIMKHDNSACLHPHTPPSTKCPQGFSKSLERDQPWHSDGFQAHSSTGSFPRPRSRNSAAAALRGCSFGWFLAANSASELPVVLSNRLTAASLGIATISGPTIGARLKETWSCNLDRHSFEASLLETCPGAAPYERSLRGLSPTPAFLEPRGSSDLLT